MGLVSRPPRLSRSPAAIGAASLFVVTALAVTACNGGPSKSAAMDAIQSNVREDGSCTLPLDILAKVKIQHVTKGLCVPKEGAARARACVDALVAANVTHRMPDSYMVGWADDVAAMSLEDLPASSRHARSLDYSLCVELPAELRNGRFPCADAKADKILRITKLDDHNADVVYSRAIVIKPTLAAIEAACGAVSRPPGEATLGFVKSGGDWVLASLAPAGSASATPK